MGPGPVGGKIPETRFLEFLSYCGGVIATPPVLVGPCVGAIEPAVGLTHFRVRNDLFREYFTKEFDDK